MPEKEEHIQWRNIDRSHKDITFTPLLHRRIISQVLLAQLVMKTASLISRVSAMMHANLLLIAVC